MSRSSLRRQMFHRNFDRLLQDSALQPVQEESQNGKKHQHVSDQDSREETEEFFSPPFLTSTHVANKDSREETGESGYRKQPSVEEDEDRSPIYRPKPDLRATRQEQSCTARPLSDYENSSPIYAEPWSPGTPRVEQAQRTTKPAREDPEKSHCRKTNQPVTQPLIFQYPDLNNNDVPLSPIHSGPLHSSTPHWTGSQTRTCDEVKALPMSPALFLAQQASTPGPSDEDFQDARCQSIREHSIFSFPECNMCRICHEDGSKEKLVSPCHCTGTMGMLHVSCLEKWLGSSNTTKCEICQFQFKVLKKRHPIKWYMHEPSLHEDRRFMVKDISLMVSVSLLVILISILCLTFAGKLMEEEEEKHVPSIILIVVAAIAVIAYCVWIGVMSRRIHHRFSQWNQTHHVVQIKQSGKLRTSNKIFRRFPFVLAQKLKGLRHGSSVERDLKSSTYISYSLESYKAAMFNPVTPAHPLLEHATDITMLDVDSPSVMSLDDEDVTESSVCYYQPPGSGQTSIMYSETGRLLRETGV